MMVTKVLLLGRDAWKDTAKGAFHPFSVCPHTQGRQANTEDQSSFLGPGRVDDRVGWSNSVWFHNNTHLPAIIAMFWFLLSADIIGSLSPRYESHQMPLEHTRTGNRSQLRVRCREEECTPLTHLYKQRLTHCPLFCRLLQKWGEFTNPDISSYLYLLFPISCLLKPL